jgi:hypothetical protein
MHPSPRLAIVALILTAAVPAAAQVVDHTSIDSVPSLSQSVMDAIGQQRWFFSHASVGGNMVAGLGDLHGSNPTRFQLVTSSVGYNSGEMRANDPPVTTAAGTVYECDRSNPGWSAKYTIFDNSVRTSGWRLDSVDVAMDKLCYIDENANVTTYLATMTALEAAYPATVFVYTTMPLTTSEGSDNVLRNDYNTAVRAHCLTNGCLLFDLADMEAHEASGTPCTFITGPDTYQKLCDGYTDDGGHLNSVGRQRIATGWYAVAAILVDQPIFANGFEDGTLNGWSTSAR